jgi:hypothetical protein
VSQVHNEYKLRILGGPRHYNKVTAQRQVTEANNPSAAARTVYLLSVEEVNKSCQFMGEMDNGMTKPQCDTPRGVCYSVHKKSMQLNRVISIDSNGK